MNVSINFNVLVEAFSQTGENWLSYSEFCEIFKPNIEKSERNHSYSSRSHGTNMNALFSQILYLTLLNEY
jgi:hypothetical protein